MDSENGEMDMDMNGISGWVDVSDDDTEHWWVRFESGMGMGRKDRLLLERMQTSFLFMNPREDRMRACHSPCSLA